MGDMSDKMVKWQEAHYHELVDQFLEIHDAEWGEYLLEQFEKYVSSQDWEPVE